MEITIDFTGDQIKAILRKAALDYTTKVDNNWSCDIQLNADTQKVSVKFTGPGGGDANSPNVDTGEGAAAPAGTNPAQPNPAAGGAAEPADGGGA